MTYPKIERTTEQTVNYNRESICEAIVRGVEIFNFQMIPGWYVFQSEEDTDPLGPYGSKEEANEEVEELNLDY